MVECFEYDASWTVLFAPGSVSGLTNKQKAVGLPLRLIAFQEPPTVVARHSKPRRTGTLRVGR